MEYTFSWGWFLIGLIILAVGTALVLWHQKIADNFGSGVVSYGRYQLFGLIACIVGFIVMLNLHTFLLRAVFGMFFGRG